MVLEMERLACIFDGIELNCVHFAGQSPTFGEHLHIILPLRGRNLTKISPHWPVAISLRCNFDGRIERAEFAEVAVQRKVEESFDRRIRRRPLQTSIAIFGGKYGLLISQLIKNQAEWSHFRGGIERGQAVSEPYCGDHVIELCWRRDIGIEFARAVDQHGITLNSLRAHERRK